MWVSINMGYEYTIVKHIPVAVENLGEGKALKYPVPKTVAVRFRGIGWFLAGLYLSPDVKYYIDVSSLNTERFVITSQDLHEHLKLPAAVQPMDVKPESLVLALEEYKEKRVPVVPHVSLDFYPGYGQVGPALVTPESVLIGGAREIIEPITQWQISYQRFEKLRAPVDKMLPLQESGDLSITVFQEAARLQINVQPFAEKTFTGIVTRVTGAPINREVIFIPPKMDIIARGGIDQLAKLSSNDFQALVDYQTLVQDSTGTVGPVLMGPEGVKIVSRTPERFQYFIRKRL